MNRLLSAVSGIINDVRNSSRIIWKSSPSMGSLALALNIFSATLPIFVVWVGKLIIDLIAAAGGSHKSEQYAFDIHNKLLGLIALELCLVGLAYLIDRGTTLTRTILAARLGRLVTTQILKKVSRLTLAQAENSEIQDKIANARRESATRSLSIVTQVSNIFRSFTTILCYLGFLWAYSPISTIVLVISAIPGFFAELKFSESDFLLKRRRSLLARKLSYTEHILTTPDHAKEVRAYGLTELLLANHNAMTQEIRSQDDGLSVTRTITTSLLNFLGLVVLYAFYTSVIINAFNGNISIGDMTLYLASMRLGQSSFQGGLLAIARIREDGQFLAYYRELMAIKEHCTQATSGPKPNTTASELIRFDNVSFKYESTENWVLRDISFTVRCGERIAVLGENGSGKSTLIKLLCGLYLPTEGSIYINGVSTKYISRDEIMSTVSVMFQDYCRYSLTLAENVAFGRFAYLNDFERINSALEKASAGGILSALPSGINSALGRRVTDGAELSGGQWQRIALARALIHDEAKIFILDEPTAALDLDAEQSILSHIRSLSRNKTLVLITHRQSLVKESDLIIVLRGGQLIERGTHNDLIALNNVYAGRFKAQANAYS